MSGYINRTHRNLDNSVIMALMVYQHLLLWRLADDQHIKSHRNPRPNELEVLTND